MATKAFEGSNGKLERLRGVRVEIYFDDHGQRHFKEIPDSEFTIETQLVLISAGFTGPTRAGLLDSLNPRMNRRGTIWTNHDKMTSIEGVFAAGDNVRGQSLVVWAIAEGRDAALGVDKYLTGRVRLPAAFSDQVAS